MLRSGSSGNRHREHSSHRGSKVSIGCCGWPENQKGYYRDFDVLEVQENVLSAGRIEKYEKWRTAAPAGFEFSIKAWQLITHESSSTISICCTMRSSFRA